MAPQKATSPKPVPPAPFTPQPSTSTARKAWVKKTTVDVVLDQIAKQEKKVGEMRAEIAHEERALAKLNRAKEVLEEQ